MKYKQLTAADRGVIEGLLQAEYTQEAMAKMLGVDPATVSREIKKLQSPQRQKYLVRKLQLGWSPE